jgi:cation/acetate symporter
MFVSFTYVAGQMRGVGIVFSRFLEVDINTGVYIGMAIVFFYAVLGGMKGITYTQVAQYCVLIFAYMVPGDLHLADDDRQSGPAARVRQHRLRRRGHLAASSARRPARELGFAAYTSGTKSTLDVFCITAALMVGTAGLPHVIIRFYTVPRVRDARISVGWALVFIALLYTTRPPSRCSHAPT